MLCWCCVCVWFWLAWSFALEYLVGDPWILMFVYAPWAGAMHLIDVQSVNICRYCNCTCCTGLPSCPGEKVHPPGWYCICICCLQIDVGADSNIKTLNPCCIWTFMAAIINRVLAANTWPEPLTHTLYWPVCISVLFMEKHQQKTTPALVAVSVDTGSCLAAMFYSRSWSELCCSAVFPHQLSCVHSWDLSHLQQTRETEVVLQWQWCQHRVMRTWLAGYVWMV